MLRLTDAQFERLPILMQEIVEADRSLRMWSDPVSRVKVVPIAVGDRLRSRRARCAELRARAHEIYGHTPSRGDRGPSLAGALAG